MYWVSGYESIGESRISSSDSGLRRQAIGFSDPLRNALAATLPASPGDAVLVHVAVDLHAEELRRQRQAAGAVPVAQPGRLRVHAERTALVLVEADGDAEVVDAGHDRVGGGEQRRAAGGAAVGRRW